MTLIEIPDGFGNDGTYKCIQCDIGMMCFTTEADTQFCPGCGARNMGFDELTEEEAE